MSCERRSFGATYAAFVAVSAISGGVVALIGYGIVSRLDVEHAVRSVLAGCGISWLASCAGAIPITVALAGGSRYPANAILGSTAIRSLVAGALVVPLLFSGWFDRTTLVGALAGSYLVMLLLDSVFAVRAMKRLTESDSR